MSWERDEVVIALGSSKRASFGQLDGCEEMAVSSGGRREATGGV